MGRGRSARVVTGTGVTACRKVVAGVTGAVVVYENQLPSYVVEVADVGVGQLRGAGVDERREGVRGVVVAVVAAAQSYQPGVARRDLRQGLYALGETVAGPSPDGEPASALAQPAVAPS